MMKKQKQSALKGQCHEIFDPQFFFHQSTHPIGFAYGFEFAEKFEDICFKYAGIAKSNIFYIGRSRKDSTRTWICFEKWESWPIAGN
jgi:hypothetical protein